MPGLRAAGGGGWDSPYIRGCPTTSTTCWDWWDSPTSPTTHQLDGALFTRVFLHDAFLHFAGLNQCCEMACHHRSAHARQFPNHPRCFPVRKYPQGGNDGLALFFFPGDLLTLFSLLDDFFHGTRRSA